MVNTKLSGDKTICPLHFSHSCFELDPDLTFNCWAAYISISTIKKWVQKHQAILDGALKENDEELSNGEASGQIKSILLGRIKTLAASSNKLSDVIAALEYFDNRKDEEYPGGNLNAFLERLVEKSR